MKTRLLALLLLLASAASVAQTTLPDTSQRPRLGLVLSGGGAKGLAHIGILRMIDSLGIHVDYLTGTSMGGVLSGLYSMGYSADSIKQIALNIQWDRVLSNRVPLRNITIEEKDEYDNYMLEFPVVEWKPSLPGSMIEGQYISELFSSLTFRGASQLDFKKLATSLTLTSADIVNGGLVLQPGGSLPLAMRATMAIPAAFSPVIINNKILVDGGLERNFPVDEARAMGANYIIGGYTGFRLHTARELENPMKLITQTHALKAIEDANDQKTRTNLLIDFSQPLLAYGTSNFSKFREIIAIGEQDARRFLPALREVKAWQERYGIRPTRRLLPEVAVPIAQIKVFYEDGTPVDAATQARIQAISRILPNSNLTRMAIEEAVTNIYGTRLFHKVYYTFSQAADNRFDLNFLLKSAEKNMFKAAIHYDTDQSAGVLLNYTYRNLFNTKSRLVATIDLAERLKGRINYYQFLDSRQRWWVKPSVEFVNWKSNDLFLQVLSQQKSFSEVNFFQSRFQSAVALGYKINARMQASAGVGFHRITTQRKLGNILNLFDDDNFWSDKNLFVSRNVQSFLRLEHDTRQSAYFSKRGHQFHAELQVHSQNQVSLGSISSRDSVGLFIQNFLDPVSLKQLVPGASLRFFVNERAAIPVSPKLSVVSQTFLGVNQAFRTRSTTSLPDSSFYILPHQYFTPGGYLDRQEADSPWMAGYKRRELPSPNVLLQTIGFQFNPKGKLFVTPLLSLGFISSDQAFFKQENFTYGLGLDVGLMSFIGPVKLTYNHDGQLSRSRLFFSMGYYF